MIISEKLFKAMYCLSITSSKKFSNGIKVKVNIIIGKVKLC